MPDVPSFVGPTAGGILAIALFIITTQRGDIRDLATSRASEAAWRRERRKARFLLILAAGLLIALGVVAVPAIVDLVEGDEVSGGGYVAAAAFVVGLSLVPFSAGNARMAATHLAERRRQLYGLD